MQSHQSCLITWPTECEWDCFILGQAVSSHPMTNRLWATLLNCLLGCLIMHVSSHDQQKVNNTTLFLCHAISSILSHPITNRLWVTQLYLFAIQSHQSCLIPWPTGSESHCFMSLPSILIIHVSSHDLQEVGDIATYISLQAVSSTGMSHLWPSGSEWHCFISLAGSLINHVSPLDQQGVSDTAVLLWQVVLSIMSHPMTIRQ